MPPSDLQFGTATVLSENNGRMCAKAVLDEDLELECGGWWWVVRSGLHSFLFHTFSHIFCFSSGFRNLDTFHVCSEAVQMGTSCIIGVEVAC